MPLCSMTTFWVREKCLFESNLRKISLAFWKSFALPIYRAHCLIVMREINILCAWRDFFLIVRLFDCCLLLLEIRLRASCMLHICIATELLPQPQKIVLLPMKLKEYLGFKIVIFLKKNSDVSYDSSPSWKSKE